MTDETPFISIIIPTFNRPEPLHQCLLALMQLEYPGGCFEVIVVDDGGDPDARMPFEASHRNIRFLHQQNAGPGAARNLGASHAQGELLAFTDDDCRPRPGWLRALARTYLQTPGTGVGGRTINAVIHNPFSSASQAVLDVMHRYFNEESGRCVFFPSNNALFPRKEFLDIGGFDERFRTAEDRNLCDRWIASGKVLKYAPDAVVEHLHPLSLSGLFTQHFQYGKGASRFYRTRKQAHGGGLSVDLHFYGRLLAQPFVCGGGLRFRLFSSIVVTQVANAAGFAWQSLSDVPGKRMEPRLPRGLGPQPKC